MSRAQADDQRFLESEWDYCVVLDACRYDVFEEVYEEYLDGSLEKRQSPGSSTPEWAYRTFTGDHDIAYFSGNPFINGTGIPLNELAWGASCDYEWTATEHIREVVDVWREGWHEQFGTVPPGGVAASLRDHADTVGRRDRTVLHYMQPHAPYLTRETGGKLTRIKNGIASQDDGNADTDGTLSAVGNSLRPYVEKLLGQSSFAMKAGLWMELGFGTVLRDGTREAAMTHHEENLRVALESIADLLPELDGSVVVTADHGEAFGEEGIWEHHIETHIPPLVEVPWLRLR
jgi:hypothetical protein